ncbi:hypothetical protein LSM04_004041 [Trypanosoma melophagium]|uniref:uncharacterized protein n=1 Tax=Trypanosoma melophagium TaxID=715481 RepID=UPI00351A61BC|nr:hypothetical protein LSM04_004041 [Trypanosoma melophagium]
MDFAFPVFVPASESTLQQQQQQQQQQSQQQPKKSLWQLVIEDGSDSNVGPERGEPWSMTAKHAFNNNNNDEWDERYDRRGYHNDDDNNNDTGVGTSAAVGIASRSSWKPTPYMIDHLSSAFISQYGMMHGIECSSRTPLPPCLRLQDLQLPPFVLKRFQQQLRFPNTGKRSARDTSACNEHPGLRELQEVVFGTAAVTPNSNNDNDSNNNNNNNGLQELVLRALQQFTLTSMLLGHHTLSVGPRGCGKKTAGVLATALLTLARESTVKDTEKAMKDNTMKCESDEMYTVRPPAPRAVILVSSYSEVQQCNRWLQAVFTAYAFAPMTFRRGAAEIVALPVVHDNNNNNNNNNNNKINSSNINNKNMSYYYNTSQMETIATLPTPVPLPMPLPMQPPEVVTDTQKTEASLYRHKEEDDHYDKNNSDYHYRHDHLNRKHDNDHSERVSRKRSRDASRDRHYRHDSYRTRRRRHHTDSPSAHEKTKRRRHRSSSRYSQERRHRRSRSRHRHREGRERSRRRRRHHSSRNSDSTHNDNDNDNKNSRSRRERERKGSLSGGNRHERHYHKEKRRSRDECHCETSNDRTLHEEMPQGASNTLHQTETAAMVPITTTKIVVPPPVSTRDEIPHFLQQRVPILVTTHQSLVEALQLVRGQAEVLPLESVRVVCISDVDRISQPTSQIAAPASWWISFSNAVDVDCQYILSAARLYDEVNIWMRGTILRDSPDVVHRYRQRDDTVWHGGVQHVLDVVRVEEIVEERSKQELYERVDAAKLQRLVDIVIHHFRSASGNDKGHTSGTSPASVGRVVIVVSSRKEQELIFQHVQSELAKSTAWVQCVCHFSDFYRSNADVLVTYDWMVSLASDTENMTGRRVSLLVNYGFPRILLAPGKEEELLECVVIRTRTFLHRPITLKQERESENEEKGGEQNKDESGFFAEDGNDSRGQRTVITLLTERQVYGRLGKLLLSRAQAISSLRNTNNSSVQRLFQWYPRKGGGFLGDLLAGHNLFIADIPRKFDAQHARHFSLVESLCLTPLFTLSIVQYFSGFFLYPARRQVIPVLMTELTRKTETIHQWTDVMGKSSPGDAIVWRAGLVLSQVMLFPLWLLLSAFAPQLMHATLERTNHILYQKCACISKGAPPFVEKCMNEAREAEVFHTQQLNTPTDYCTAVLIVALVLYLTS